MKIAPNTYYAYLKNTISILALQKPFVNIIFVRLNLKKFTTYLSVLFYLIATTGVSAKVHFCGGEVAEIAVLSGLNGNVCGCGAEDKTGDCCQEKSYEYKVGTKHLVKSNIQDNSTPLISAATINNFLKEVKLIEHISWITPQYKQGQSPPLRILHGVFRL